MSERRPHWDAHLIDAIGADLRDVYENGYSEDQIFRVIAAVEDWHKAKRASRDRTHSDECWRWHQECAEHLIERQQAALRRVRQVAERFASESGPDPYGFGVARAVAADAVLDALGGDG